MKCRDLILYILANSLEDEPVFKDGKFIGFMTVDEMAAKMSVGTATVRTLIHLKRLEGVTINQGLYVPVTSKLEEKISV